jgi:hypothetical protein
MSTLRKRPEPGRDWSKVVHRIARLSGARNPAVRKVAKPAKAAAPSQPRIPFNGERQTLVCLYLHLLTSEHPEVDVSVEFFRCFKHLLEGGDADSLPLQLIGKDQFHQELKQVLASKAYLLDDPPTHGDDTHDHHDDHARKRRR